MKVFHKIFSSFFGIGYIKGGGSVAAAVCALCWYIAWKPAYPPELLSVFITIFVTAAGVISSSAMVPVWGKDPSKVVIDEVAGMCAALLFLPVKVKYVLAAFVLFRFFDILKPLFIRKMEALPKGAGIMADDILAGIYTNLLLQAVVWFNLF